MGRLLPGAEMSRSLFICLALAALVLAGCELGDGKEPERHGRIDSAKSFEGEKRRIAGLIERFEVATRRRDPRELCESILGPRGGGFGERLRDPVTDCRRDPEFAPTLELERSGGARAFDLVVESVAIDPSKDRFKPDATAVVRMPSGAPFDREVFELMRLEGDWRVSSRRPQALRLRGAYTLKCPGGEEPESASTDVFGLTRKRPRGAREAIRQFLRGGALGFDVNVHLRPDTSPAYRRAVMADLVRIEIDYGFAGARYDYRPDGGSPLARFVLERIDGQYFIAFYERCPGALPRPSRVAE